MWKKEKKALKEGKRIQYYYRGDWFDIETPSFIEYRIHPEDIEPITEWNDKLAVHCKTKEQIEKVIELQPKKKGFVGQWDIYNTKTCITNDGFYCSKEFYKEEGFEVIKAKEFLKRYNPKKEIGKEPLKEGEWCAFWNRGYKSYKVAIYIGYINSIYCHRTYGIDRQFALPLSVGHEAIVEAMEETNKL